MAVSFWSSAGETYTPWVTDQYQKDRAMKDDRSSPFPDAHSDRDTAQRVPDTPQTRAPAYRLAFADEDFMCRDELRPVRLQRARH
jgi:hypothetical protein